MYSVIRGVGHSVPSKILTNNELEQMVDTDDQWIVQRTGIGQRRIADEKTATSDLAIEAARMALANGGIDPEELDLIIVATVTPDYAFPSTACLVQRELKAWKAAAFDLEAACSGFLFCLSVADQYIRNGSFTTILLIAGDVLSKITDYNDRNTCILFGDGAGAAVLQSQENPGLLATEIGADGGGSDLLIQPAGGSRAPASHNTVNNRQHFIQMAGQEVFKFAVRIMVETSRRVLAKAQLDTTHVDLLIPHQANIRIIDSACRRLNIPREKVWINLDRYGNMSGASIPVALSEAVVARRIQSGDTVLLVGFGGGLTWGASVFNWN